MSVDNNVISNAWFSASTGYQKMELKVPEFAKWGNFFQGEENEGTSLVINTITEVPI